MEKEDMMQKYRSRKWRLTLLILLVAVIFAGIDMLTSQLANVLTALGATYNVGQGIIDWQKAKNNPPEIP